MVIIPRESEKCNAGNQNQARRTHCYHCGGTLAEMLMELGVTVKSIHQQMERTDPIAAALFKAAVVSGFSDENGPVWGHQLRMEGIGMVMPGRNGGGRDDKG